jgi:mRNA interferase MazF
MNSPTRGEIWWADLEPTRGNGLAKDGCVDVLQLRGISFERFSKRIGVLSPDDMAEVMAAVALVMEMD